MTSDVLLHPKVAKEQEKTEHHLRLKILARLGELRGNPKRMGKVLKHSDFWSTRIGDYRVIYEIDNSRRQVIILFIGHRSKIYDDFSKML